MKCIECGHELKDGAVYCIRCGAMQISMDGKPIERDHLGRASDQQWPEVAPGADKTAWRPSVRDQAGGGGRHSRDFETPPDHGGRRLAAIIIGLIMAAVLIAILAFSCMGRQSGVEASSETSGDVESTETTESSSASSAAASSSSTSSSSASSSSASSASASASSASASSAAATAQQQQQQAQPQPQPQPQQQALPAGVGTQQSYAPTPATGDYVLGDSSTRYYSQAELQNMSVSDLYYARNEIFARHGRMFLRSDLQQYFNSKSWYTPIYTPDQWNSLPNQLNDCELRNADLMKSVEASKGSPYL